MYTPSKGPYSVLRSNSKRGMNCNVGEVDEVLKEEDLVDGKLAQSQRAPYFKLDVTALHNVRAPKISHTDQPLNHTQHTSVAEWVIYFCRKSLPAGEMVSGVDYMDVSKGCEWAAPFYNRG